jgi:hypothetical protein
MAQNYLEYPLFDGYVHNWLVAGPAAQLLEVSPQNDGEIDQQKESLLTLKPKQNLSLSQPPNELEPFVNDGNELTWKYFRCAEDHMVYSTGYFSAWSLLSSWGFTQIILPQALSVELILTARHPVNIWLNGEQVLCHTRFSQEWQRLAVKVTLQPRNELYVCFQQISAGESALQFSLRMAGSAILDDLSQVKVQVPTKARFPHRYQHFERILDHAYLENIVHYRGDHFNLRWDEEIKDESYVDFQVQDSKGAFYVSGKYPVDPRNPQDVGHNFRLYERPYWVTLMATGREYWDQNLRYTVRLPIHILDNRFSVSPYGSPYQRRQEALTDASKHESNLFAMLARMELGQWDMLLPKTIREAIQKVNQRQVDSEKDLLGLLMIVYRFIDHELFPSELREPIVNCILNFRFSPSDPGNDSLDFTKESNSILFAAGELLAGQRFPERVFTTSAQNGQFHLQRGIESTISWILQRGQYGFVDWHSNSDWPAIFLALSQVASLADDDDSRELAAILLDKMLFLLAIHSFNGSFAASHGRTASGMLKSSQLAATSGVMRMLWGTGVFNHHIQGTVGLALSEYEYPSFFFKLATDSSEEIFIQEHHANPSGPKVDLVTYKTPDFMLSSVQDFRPGEHGHAEHLWQATFGPEALVFVNHPACSSEDPAFQPGFWLGNGCLPRIAQWKDVLICIYQLPPDDLMGFTHAYFPLPAFDDFFFSEPWVFLKKGNGYLALASANGMEFIRKGPNAYREMRSPGLQNAWVCQLGREKMDGDFTEFRRKTQALPLSWLPGGVQLTSLRGDELVFGWQGAFRINGVEKKLHFDKHIESPYCITDFPPKQMEIAHGDVAVRLNFQVNSTQ